MNGRAELYHWGLAVFGIIGIVVVFNHFSSQQLNPTGPEVGVDITALLVMGG